MKKILVLFSLIFITAASSASASTFYYSSSPYGYYDNGFNISIGTGYSPIYTTGCVYTTSPYIYSNIISPSYCNIGWGINYVHRHHNPPPPPPRIHSHHGHGGSHPHVGGPHGGGPHGGGPHGGPGGHGGGHHR